MEHRAVGEPEIVGRLVDVLDVGFDLKDAAAGFDGLAEGGFIENCLGPSVEAGRTGAFSRPGGDESPFGQDEAPRSLDRDGQFDLVGREHELIAGSTARRGGTPAGTHGQRMAGFQRLK